MEIDTSTDEAFERECRLAGRWDLLQTDIANFGVPNTTSARAKTTVGGVYDAGAHYRKVYKGIKLDPFRIADIYECNGIQLTILKKTLVPGKRGSKDTRQDYIDIINAATRAIDMLEEDEANDS